MQLRVTTDYAIRMMFYVAANSHRDRIPSAEMSDKLGIPASMVLKIGNKLKKEGLVDVIAGTSGGYKINRRPEDINLLEIIDLFEPTVRINRCLEDDEYCSRFATKECPVRKLYTRMQKDIEDSLSRTSLKDLL